MITEYPYYAVKSPMMGILISTISDSKRWTMEDFEKSTGKRWGVLHKDGYSIVRVAIVEEPK